MKTKYRFKVFRGALYISAGIFILFLFFQCGKLKNPNVTVYSSSLDGDRLTKRSGFQFQSDRELSCPVINVDEKSYFQKIEGFGATFNEAGMICLNSLSVKDQNTLLMNLFDPDSGAGFSVMKSPVAACDFSSAGPWYSYDDMPNDTLMQHFSIERDLGPNGLLTFIRRASEYGRFIIEAPMDFAPDWMYFGLKKDEKHIKPEFYIALARYYCKYLQSYADNGVTIDYLNLFNEADNSWYSNVSYKVIGNLIKNYLIPQIQSGKIRVNIQLGETSNRPEALQKFPVILNDPEIRKHIHSLTVHGYDWDKFSALTELHNAFPDLPIWQTEVCYARVDNKPTNVPSIGPLKLPVFEFSDGEFWGNMIMNDMNNWVSAWIYWNMILDQDGGPWLISTEHGDPDNNFQHPVVIVNRITKEVTYTGLYYYLAHFSKFIIPGAYRIGSSGDSKNLNFAAFKNPDGSIILNIINNDDDTDCKILWNKKMVFSKLKAHSITTLKWNSSDAKSIR